ncbi:hypothetical protein KR032_010725 [Drosophila birchii]|nr:hypothetical protein KR032_010725 [Drosophila birchii]
MLRRGESGFASALILSSLCLGLCRGYYSLEVGDPCPTESYRSRCQVLDDCETLSSHLREGRLTIRTVMNCGFTSRSEKICCPVEDANSPVRFDSSDASSTTSTTTTSSTTTTTTSTTTTTTTPAPAPTPADNGNDWLSIFQTDHEYVQESKTPIPLRPTRDSVTVRDTSDGAECIAPLYEGQCRGVSACPSVDTLLLQGRLRDEDVTTCRDGTHEEIICCPLSLPLAPRKTDTRLGGPGASSEAKSQPDPQEAAAIARADALLPHYRHLASLAHPNAAFDGHLHHCSALVLTPQLLLSAAGCQRPSHAVFGVADMRDADVDEDYLADIARLAQFQRDLSLIRLQDPLRLGHESSANVSLAPICSQFELTRLQVSGSLVAVAWGKGEATDCPLYELPMQLRPNWACEDLPNYGGVKELGAIHLCMSPEGGDLALQRFSNDSTCAPCPASVGSVLHLVRPGGSRCVLGIATPTGADCESRAMYFTSLLSQKFRRFVEQEQREL